MKLNKEGYLLITKHEGLSLKPYLCPAKIPTIGYGNTYYSDGKRVTLLDKQITKEEAKEIDKLLNPNVPQYILNPYEPPKPTFIMK